MRKLLVFVLIIATFWAHSQQMKIITTDKSQIEVTVLNDSTKSAFLREFNGRQDDAIRKKWTSRTFRLSDGRIIVEFFDRQAVLVNRLTDLNKLEEVRFVKNTMGFLKKNISYKIELDFEKVSRILQKESPKKLTRFKSEMVEYSDYEVYELNTGQILFIDKSDHFKSAIIYENIKTLASDNTTIGEEQYGSKDDEHLMKRLAQGDALLDYEPNEQLIYPKYLNDVVANHKLNLIETKVFVTRFYGNLYKSSNGYYILIDEVNQKNGAGDKMPILSLRIFENLQAVKEAQAKYETFEKKGVHSEHFYQNISDKYGKNFPAVVNQLIDSLPLLLNIDKNQLTLDSCGMDLVDEALKWNGTNYQLFDQWFPSVLAYYGQCYINQKKDGQWTLYFDKKYEVWIPVVKLREGSLAFDWRDFYKGLAEGPIPLRWAGDWDKHLK